VRCYFSQAITLLKQNEMKQYLEYYDFIEERLTHDYRVAVFNPIKEEASITPREIYRRDLGALNRADFVVAEVSVVSWGVGEELVYAILRGKPILALHNTASEFKLSEMISGAGLRLREYDGGRPAVWKEQLTGHIAEFVTELKQYLYLQRRLCARMP